MKTRILAALALTVLAAGCSLGKPLPPTTTYALEPKLPEAAAAPRRNGTLRLGTVRVAPAFAGSHLVYRLDDVRFIADPYEAFITDPAALLGNGIATWLDRAGPFATTLPPGSLRSVGSAPWALEVTVTDLYGDFRGGSRPEAVLAIRFTLLDLTEARQGIVLDRSYTRRVAVSRAAPDALVRGWNEALAGILGELVEALATVPPAPAATPAPAQAP